MLGCMKLGRLPDRIKETLAEWTVVGSYSGLGIRRRARHWDPHELERDLSSQVAVITGANSGIGFETTRALVERGAHCVLVCRSEKRGRESIDRLGAAAKSRAELVLADLENLDSTREAARRITTAHPEIRVLVNNAGASSDQRRENPQGIESMLATNVLSPFLLTRDLLPSLRRGGSPEHPSRVIFVSSGGMYTSGLDLEDLQWRKRPYNELKVYAENKRALVVMNEEFARREGSEPRVVFHSMHPGWADTPLVRERLPRFARVLGRWLRTPAEGADTVVWLAMASRPESSSGLFWLDREPRRTALLPRTRVSAARAADFFERCKSLSEA